MGLLGLAKDSYARLVKIEKTIAEILKEEKELGGYGHISDTIWGGEEMNVDDLLDLMEIKLNKK